MRITALVLPAVTAVLLVGCSEAAPAPTTSPSAVASAEPTTLDELADALVEDGVVDMAAFPVLVGNPSTLQMQIIWTEQKSPEDQLAALAEINERIDLLPIERPAESHVILGIMQDGVDYHGVQTAYDPGTDVLRAMLEAVDNSPCTSASLNMRNLGEGPRAVVELSCFVDAPDIVGLASGYDKVTSHLVDVEGVDETEWQVSLEGQTTSDALLRLEEGPFDGRQELFVGVAEMAKAAAAYSLTFIDSGEGVLVAGFAEAEQAGLCAAIRDRILSAGVERAQVTMQLPEPIGDETWACYLVQ